MVLSKLCLQCLLSFILFTASLTEFGLQEFTHYCPESKKAYEELLGLVVELIQVELNKTPSPNYVLSDFELSFMKALKKVFPNTQTFGCLFHFGQMVWRRVQKYGLQSSLSQAKNVDLRSNLHSLIALAFFPVADV